LRPSSFQNLLCFDHAFGYNLRSPLPRQERSHGNYGADDESDDALGHTCGAVPRQIETCRVPADPMREQQLRPGRLITTRHCEKCGKVVHTSDSLMLHAVHDCVNAPPPLPGEVWEAVRTLRSMNHPLALRLTNAVADLRAHIAAQESELASLRSENAALRAAVKVGRRHEPEIVEIDVTGNKLRRARIEELEWVKAACPSMSSGDWDKLWDRVERLRSPDRAQAQAGGGV